MRPTSFTVILVTLLSAVGCHSRSLPARSPAAPSPVRQDATSLVTWPVSPTVVVTSIAHYVADPPAPPPSPPHAGPVTLDLLVFWRGSPLWFVKDGPRSERGSGDDKGHVNVRVELAGVVLEVNLDREQNVARVAGHEVALVNGNVILVDGVDSPGGPRVVGTEWVDPTTDPLPDGLYTVLRRAPALLPFMQCEAPLPATAGSMREVLAASCARMATQ